MPEYATLDYDISGGKRVAVSVDRGTGELQAFALDKDAVASNTVQIVASGVERAQILAMPDHCWLVFYNVGTTFYAQLSEDGGRTWGAQETLPVTLVSATASDGTSRFRVTYLPRHRLIALIYPKFVSPNNCIHLTALRRDDAGTWAKGVETNLAGTYNGTVWTRSSFTLSTLVGTLLGLNDGQIAIIPAAGGEGWFIGDFGWASTPTINYRLTNTSGLGAFASPRYRTAIRMVELQGSLLLCVGTQANRPVINLTATGGWASAVLWRAGSNAWNGLRDTGGGTPPLTGTALQNYIALAPVTTYPTGAATLAGYAGECGQLRRLPDGSAELLYHDRDGTLKFKRNRMTAYSYYPSTAMPDFSTYLLTYWTTSRRDTWE